MENKIVQNKSKAEMDAERRLKKKRPISEVANVTIPNTIDMNKKRKTSEATKDAPVDAKKPTVEPV